MFVDQKILQWLETELFEGRISLGQDLPDDRKMAELVRSSHHSTREAIKRLETMGVLRLYEGKRKTIIPHLVSEPARALTPALRLHLAEARYPTRDMVQTRIMIESWALSHADREHPAMEELEHLMEIMQSDTLTPHEFHRYEVDFHVALTKLADNHLLTGMLSALRGSIEDYLLSLMGKVPLWSATATRLRAEHQAIYDAVKSGDNELAQQLVISSIEQQYTEAGIELDEETAVANSLPGSVAALEPIEVDTDDLIPEEWEEAVSPDLIAALENISGLQPAQKEADDERGTSESDQEPVYSEAIKPVDNQVVQAPDRSVVTPRDSDEAPGSPEDQEDDQQVPSSPSFSSHPVAETPVRGESSPWREQRRPRDYTDAPDYLPSTERNVLRAPEASAAGRKKRRGTVSVPVKATVIKPIDRSGSATGMIAGQVPSKSTGEISHSEVKRRAADEVSWGEQVSHDTLRAPQRSISEHELARQQRLDAFLNGATEPHSKDTESSGVNESVSGQKAHSINKGLKKKKKRR